MQLNIRQEYYTMQSDTALQARIKELETIHRHTQAIVDISAKMSVATTEQEILAPLADWAESHGATTSTLSYIHTDENNVPKAVEVAAMRVGGVPTPPNTLGQLHFSVEEFPIAKIVFDNPKVPVFVENVAVDPRADENIKNHYKQLGLSAAVAIPIRTHTGWHGLLINSWSEPQTFDDEFRALLTNLMPHITDIIAGRRAYLAEQAVRRQAEELFQMSQDLSSAGNDDEILQVVSRPFLGRGAVGAHLLKVQLDNAGEPEWVEYVNTILASPETPAMPAGTRIAPADFPLFSGLLIDHPEKSLLIFDIASEERLDEGFKALARKLNQRTTAFVPMTIAGRWVALVQFVWDELHEFSPEELALFDALPALVAPAVENHRLMENLTQMVEARTAEIQEKQQLLQAFLDNFPAQVFAKDREGRFMLSNKTTAQAYSLSPEEVIGKTIDDLIPRENTAHIWEGEKQVMETGAVLEKEEPLLQGDEIQTVQSTVFPLYNEQGQIHGIGGIVIDVTERKQAEVERERLQQEVIEAQRTALRELSSPIIPVMEGIIVLPLIGSIDTGRAREITRALLRGISEHRAKIVIMDITGVPMVDSGVADHLNKSIQAARLKGAQAIVTGMSDAVAETIVDLGVDWAELQTLRDLRTGLTEAIKFLDIDIT
jgi:rsbT co-antagonist protein RsbR